MATITITIGDSSLSSCSFAKYDKETKKCNLNGIEFTNVHNIESGQVDNGQVESGQFDCDQGHVVLNASKKIFNTIFVPEPKKYILSSKSSKMYFDEISFVVTFATTSPEYDTEIIENVRLTHVSVKEDGNILYTFKQFDENNNDIIVCEYTAHLENEKYINNVLKRMGYIINDPSDNVMYIKDSTNVNDYYHDKYKTYWLSPKTYDEYKKKIEENFEVKLIKKRNGQDILLIFTGDNALLSCEKKNIRSINFSHLSFYTSQSDTKSINFPETFKENCREQIWNALFPDMNMPANGTFVEDDDYFIYSGYDSGTFWIFYKKDISSVYKVYDGGFRVTSSTRALQINGLNNKDELLQKAATDLYNRLNEISLENKRKKET